jgi:outer membrane receptor protein involved in Fe transport
MKHFYSSLVLLLVASFGFAQNAELYGVVRDAETKDYLQGAAFKYAKMRGASSDASGRYTMSLPAGDYEFTVSYIGYKNEKYNITLAAGEKKELNVNMRPAAIQIAQVTTVSQYKKNSAKETVSTEVVTKQQIRNTNANDLGDVVSKTSGVLVQDGTISIRGGSSFSYGVGTRTAVLSDGLSLSSADRGEVQTKMAPLENVKQVEVVKGASSVVYGSSALNGVVNVITEWPSQNEPKTELETNVGIYDSPKDPRQRWWGSAPPFFGSVNVNHQRREKNLQIVTGGNVFYDKSYLQNNDGFRVRGFLKTRYIDPKIPGLSYGINGQIFVERNELFFISQDLDSLAYVPANYSGDEHQKWLIDPHLAYGNDKGHNVKVNIRYMGINRAGAGTDIDANSNSLNVDNQYQYRFRKDLLIVTAGLPFSFAFSKSNLYPGLHVNYSGAIFTQLECNYKILSVQAGVRYEIAGVDTTVITTRPIFRSGINIQAAKGTFLRASWGQGYRVPTIAEKYIAQPFVAGVFIIPNDTLRDESSWSLEFGIKQGFQIKDWKAFIDLSFFWQEYKNFIEYQVSVWPNTFSTGQQIFPDSVEFPFPGSNKILGARPLNYESARVAGYEVGLMTTGKLGPVGLQFTGGYSYNFPSKKSDANAADKYTAGEYIRDLFKYNTQRVTGPDTANVLPYRIRHLFRADMEITYWKCYLGATFNYGSIPEVVPGFYKTIANVIFGDINALEKYIGGRTKGDFFMDIRMGMKFNDRYSMGFIIKNVTNRYYSLRPGKPEPLRNFTMQFRYNF